MSTDRSSAEREFEEFALARTPHLYRSAWLLCGDRHEAEDLVQETLAKVYVRTHRRLGPALANPSAYAHTVLTRTFISARRRRSSTETPYDDLPETSTLDHAEAADLRTSLVEAMAGLSPVDRAVVVLRYLDDRPVAEVAEVLGLTSGAVRNRSIRALARLRNGALR